MKNIQIHVSKKTDVPSLVALSYQKRRTYEKAQPKFWKYAGTQAESLQTAWFETLLSKPDYILLTATYEEKIVGFIIGELISSPEVYNPEGLTLLVDDFCIDNEFDWRLVGKLLIDEIKKQAKEKGAVQIVVVCGNHDQPKADFLNESGLSIVSNWYHEEII